MSEFNKTSITKACAPLAGSINNKSQHRIWSLTQLGAGMAGQDARILSCIFDRKPEEHGNFRGEKPYAVIGQIQAYPSVSALLKQVEWRPAVTVDNVTGLLYRKLPSSNGFSNSWLNSGEDAIHSWIGNWGRVTSDRHAGVYRFEALNLSGRTRPNFPNIDELIDELLAEYVIDRLDHPVLGRLLRPTSPTSVVNSALHSAAPDEEDDDGIY